jgi:hypothetical protein
MMYQTETKIQNGFRSTPAVVWLSFITLFSLAGTATAATDASSRNEMYVDSVYSWGIWELGIEPAAGPQAPANTAMNNRALNLQFRPNDNAAYKIQSVAVPVAGPIVPPPSLPLPSFGSGVTDRGSAPTGAPGDRFK